MSDSPTHHTRLGAVVGLVGAVTAFTVVLGAGPVPSVFQLAGVNEDVAGHCDEAEHANDAECAGTTAPGGNDGSTSSTVDDRTTSSTIDDGSTTSVASGPTDPADEVRFIDAAGAGTVVVAVERGSLRLVAATPASGWRAEVEQGSGREVEVDFRNGPKRVQVNVEVDDGKVRERVRVRDVGGADVRHEDGSVVRDDDASDDSRHGPDDSVDDDSSHGSDDGVDDDHSGSGHGDDDDSDDGGSSHGRDED